MNQTIKQAVAALRRRNDARYKRGLTLAKSLREDAVGPSDVSGMIAAQVAAIRTMTVDQIIDEFIDFEELLLREASKRI